MWIQELKGKRGLRQIPLGSVYKGSAMQSPGLSGATFYGVLYIHPKFIHILESCPRNVCNLACSILQPRCLKHASGSKSHPIPVQRLLSLQLHTQVGHSLPQCSCLLTVSSSQEERHTGRLCRLLDWGRVDPI